MNIKQIILAFILCFVSVLSFAQQVFDARLYNTRPAYDNGNPNDTAKVRVYLPKASEATGRAIVVCPGGGYSSLSMQTEGYAWAEFLQSQGVAAIVLKYRLPNGTPAVPISDAEQAIKLVRMNATSWKVNRKDVGIMGFSAGGHLAATVATQSKGEAKPDFQILLYPVISMVEGYGHEGSLRQFLGKNPSKAQQKKFSADQNVNRTTPRAFIALSDDDDSVSPLNGVNYYAELYKNDVPATLHVYPGGGHGWGSKISFRYHQELLVELKAWLDAF